MSFVDAVLFKYLQKLLKLIKEPCMNEHPTLIATYYILQAFIYVQMQCKM